jgi:hypothetical protein
MELCGDVFGLRRGSSWTETGKPAPAVERMPVCSAEHHASRASHMCYPATIEAISFTVVKFMQASAVFV